MIMIRTFPRSTPERKLAGAQCGPDHHRERLSSGLRINSAKDDAAGLAISDRMTSRSTA